MEPSELFEIERAKMFWKNADVDQMFDLLLDHLAHLRVAIKTRNASSREYVQGMHVLLECEVAAPLKHETIQKVVIGDDVLTASVFGSPAKSRDELGPGMVYQSRIGNGEHAPLGRQSPLSVDSLDGLSPLSPPQCESFDLVMLSPAFGDPPTPPSEPCFEPHDCSSACVPHLPPHADHFLGQNPLQVALLCRFQRHSEGLEVLYKGPCGRSLSSMEAVLRYLLKTESLGVLHPGNFSFSPVVQPTRAPPAASPRRRDLSQGAEPVPVQLCNELDAANPPQFRYRKDRWPHGCYLSRGPLFTDCCDCTDGCGDARACACLRLSLRAAAGTELYRHQRLQRPVPTGLYECSPWCGCDRSRCLNRVVQRGLRVRLQVFRTEDRGWGVRCQDDLDSGTFVCTYAGVVLHSGRSGDEPLPPKRARDETMSDDEVEVVDEWTLPAGGVKDSSTDTGNPSTSLHVPVIQCPAEPEKLQARAGEPSGSWKR
ncbi:histone-lysine N-methyltransferase SETDB2 isoform X2 [Denticeps clupeoides]|uniref:histone-lysine N-methyltransferase SETDB2 isoform X2 n=1 Tax=Denticeps clupeoides TaxID=299321 RepID=UPI0010A4E256|nr:histone-lysine N-methyltransferase SETDB2-like isoform X2 [Denticeps clupeoides]